MAGKPKSWTAAGAARAAREARIATVQYLRDAPIARTWQASKLHSSFQATAAHLGTHADHRTAQHSALTLLFTGLGYSESWPSPDHDGRRRAGAG
jgi:hypothetical protein